MQTPTFFGRLLGRLHDLRALWFALPTMRRTHMLLGALAGAMVVVLLVSYHEVLQEQVARGEQVRVLASAATAPAHEPAPVREGESNGYMR